MINPAASCCMLRVLGKTACFLEQALMDETPTLPSPDQILASAARFLIDGHEELAANVLLSCSLQLSAVSTGWNSGGQICHDVYVTILGPRSAYDILKIDDKDLTVAIKHAITYGYTSFLWCIRS